MSGAGVVPMVARSAIIEAVLVDHLANLAPAERLPIIDDLLHRLQFERRLAVLTDDERRYMDANEELSDAQRARLSACATPAGLIGLAVTG